MQVSHIAHASLAVHTVAAVPAKTANEPLIRIRALMQIYPNTDVARGEAESDESWRSEPADLQSKLRSVAREMVNRGLAKWRDHIDENRVNAVLKEWQKDIDVAVLRKIFDRPSLPEPDKNLMS